MDDIINKSYSSFVSMFALSNPEDKAFFSIKSTTAFFLLILSSLRAYSIISLNSSQVLIKARKNEALLFEESKLLLPTISSKA